MVPSVTTAVVAWVTFTLSAGAASPPSAATIPPMIVNVMSGADISPALVAAVLSEAEAIWRPSGISFNWRRAPRVARSPGGEPAPYLPDRLLLTIGNNRGTARDGRLPLGWIVFDAVTVPEQEIYVSHANAKAMMEAARGVVGLVDQMPTMQRDTLLARAMGRALAHELGHYLLASKAHSERGLMKAVLTAVELFTPESTTLRLDASQRRAVVARLRGEPLVASR
ncbi:MAG: hypothetical protein ACRD2I_18790 [Vicinamibacterales bacterium]